MSRASVWVAKLLLSDFSSQCWIFAKTAPNSPDCQVWHWPMTSSLLHSMCVHLTSYVVSYCETRFSRSLASTDENMFPLWLTFLSTVERQRNNQISKDLPKESEYFWLWEKIFIYREQWGFFLNRTIISLKTTSTSVHQMQTENQVVLDLISCDEGSQQIIPYMSTAVMRFLMDAMWQTNKYVDVQ